MSDELETQDGIDLGGPRHVGDVLRARRLELGRELADIAHQTRVPLRHLTAIEEGKHDTLPALPYTIGFVKSYARILALDPETTAEQFRRETTKPDRVVPTMDHEPIEDVRVPTRAAALLGIGIERLSITPAGIGPMKAMIRSLALAPLQHEMEGWLRRGVDVRAALTEYASSRGIAAG